MATLVVVAASLHRKTTDLNFSVERTAAKQSNLFFQALDSVENADWGCVDVERKRRTSDMAKRESHRQPVVIVKIKW